MSTLLNLAPEEVAALAGWWAAKIGQVSEAESDRACKRIAQLRRLTAPERRYDIEHEPEDVAPVFIGFDLSNDADRTTCCVRWPSGRFELLEVPTLSRFQEDRKG